MFKKSKPLLYFIIIIGVIFNCNPLYSQQLSLDSLQSVLRKKSGVEQIGVLLQIADAISKTDAESAIKYANDALKLSEYFSDELHISICYEHLSTYFHEADHHDKALIYAQKALEQYRLLGQIHRLSGIYLQMGVIYSRVGELDSAQYYNEAALKESQQLSDTLCQVISLRSMGNISYKQGHSEQALKVFFQAMALAKHSKECISEQSKIYNNLGVLFSDWEEFDKSLNYYNKALHIADSMGFIGEVGRLYNNMGTIYWYKEKNDSAYDFYNKSLAFREKDNDKNGMAYVLNNLGMFYGSLENYKESLVYFNRSFGIFEEISNRIGMTMSLYNIGSVYQELENFDLASKYFNESLNISFSQGFGDYTLANYKALNEVYSSDENWEKAYFILEEYNRLNDSIRKVQNIDLIKGIELKFEREMNEADINILRNEMEAVKVDKVQTRIIILGAIIILILVIGLAYLVITQIKNRTNVEHMKLAPGFLRYQLNPQFINSSLSGIKELIGKDNVKEAGLFLSGFARLIRVFIETSSTKGIVLEKEIEAYHSFFKLHQLRYEHELMFEIDVASHVEIEMLAIPPFMLFPIFTHAIDFHLTHGEVNVLLEIDTNENYLKMTARIDLANISEEDHIHHVDLVGRLDGVKNRINLINKTLKDKISFSYKESIEDRGIRKTQLVVLNMPVKPM